MPKPRNSINFNRLNYCCACMLFYDIERRVSRRSLKDNNKATYSCLIQYYRYTYTINGYTLRREATTKTILERIKRFPEPLSITQAVHQKESEAPRDNTVLIYWHVARNSKLSVYRFDTTIYIQFKTTISIF